MGRPPKNKPGSKIGYLTIINDSGKRALGGNIIWHCKYICGNDVYISSGDLNRRSKFKSCGCMAEQYQKHPKDLTNKRFGLLVAKEPTNQRAKDKAIIWKCQCDCGNVTYIKSSHLIDGRTKSCGCLNSKGELKIKNLLNELNINYIAQKTFDNCRNPETGSLLFFDFYLPDYNCCIEYDGEQHFKETGLCSDTLANRQKRDNIKSTYCLNNNIKLIRIPYFDYYVINSEYIQSLL